MSSNDDRHGLHRTDEKRKLHDGRADGLVPLQPLDPALTTSCDELLTAMSHTAMSGRSLGEAADLLYEMTVDPDCFIVCTLSGAMTVAKMGMVICRMIEHGMIDCLVSTGALMAHGLTESVGLTHYKTPVGRSDKELFDSGYNRVYDTLEMEGNLNHVERVVNAVVSQRFGDGRAFGSEDFCREIGRHLADKADGPGVLRSAFEHDVPTYIPAFTDSEIGLDVATWAMGRARAAGRSEADLWSVVPAYNPFLDLMSYANRVKQAKRLAIFTIGGGVPRNWAQQVSPFFDIVSVRLGIEVKPQRFQYGVRICPEPVHWGGLSGCTYSEGISWGKFVPPSEGGRFAEVYADATVAWPLLIRGVIERLAKRR